MTSPSPTEPADTVENTVDRRLKNLQGRKPFRKGDPRINRKGRPKSFDKLRETVQAVLHEQINTPNGEALSRLQVMLRAMTSGGNPTDHKTLLEYGFGKVKDEVDATVSVEKIEPYVYGQGIAMLAPDDGDEDEAEPADTDAPNE